MKTKATDRTMAAATKYGRGGGEQQKMATEEAGPGGAQLYKHRQALHLTKSACSHLARQSRAQA